MLGEGDDTEGRRIREKYSDFTNVDKAYKNLEKYWNDKINKLTIETPSEAMNTMINIWNLYQSEVNVMFSRFASFIEVGGRTGLGYRDTAQDSMTIPHSNPEKCKQRIVQLLNGLVSKGYGLHLFQPEWFEKKEEKYMDSKTISVIVPVYNTELYLEECLESLIRQSLTDIEIILVNDGSTDKSATICQLYAKKDKRIKYIEIENAGVSNARNIGIKNAKGKYIMFADSDDYVDSKWCESLYSVVEENKFCICNIYCVDYINNNIYTENDIDTYIKKFSINQFYEVYKLKLLNQPYNKIYEKKILDKSNIKFNEDLSLGEDLLFNLDYLLQCNEIEIINEKNYFYIKGQTDSLCNKFYPNFYEIQTKIYLKMIDIINNTNALNNQNLKDCYTEFLYSLILSINNIFLNKEYNFRQKVKGIEKILKSNVFENCLRNANQDKFNKIYWSILKTKNFIGILSYYKLYEFKSKLSMHRRIKNES